MTNGQRAALGGVVLAGAGIAGAAVASFAIAAAFRRRKPKLLAHRVSRRARKFLCPALYCKTAIRLEDQVVLITGSSRGLGLALAEECGRRGAKVVLTARDAAELDRARSLLLGRRAIREAYVFVATADLRSKEQADDLVRRATEHFGRVDVLINNAGVITVGPVENQTVQGFHDVMETNFFSGVHCFFAVIPQMLARGSGAIVNIASIGGKVPVPHLLPYTASKFAAVGFSEGLDAELRSKGIRVTTVCPGLMRTGSHLNALFTGDAAREYRWFSVSASLPGISIAAARAARTIVKALVSGKREIAITPQAAIAARLAGICPAMMIRTMQVVNGFLPKPVAAGSEPQRGATVRNLEITPAMPLGARAARRYNQMQATDKNS